MNTSFSNSQFEEIALAEAHFSKAPSAFFRAWKRGVELVGPRLFGNGTR